MDIYISRTQGFCSGVAMAIEIVEKALKTHGIPLYIFHEIVHNTHVVNNFRERGVVFVENIDEVPKDSVIIFSAHGIPPVILKKAKEHNLKCIDATCPLVKKIHNAAIRFSKEGYKIILIGHKRHQEIIGTAGYVKPELLNIIENEADIDKLNISKDSQVAYLTQTTLSVDDTRDIIKRLKSEFPNLVTPDRNDICYATQRRQDAIKELAELTDIIIVCGSPNSSNGNRLKETGLRAGVPSYIVDSASELDMTLLEGKEKIGISSGASVPRFIVDELVETIRKQYSEVQIRLFENPEKKAAFPLPKI